MNFYQIYLSKAVSVGWDEVEAAVDPAVDDALAVQTALGVEKSRELIKRIKSRFYLLTPKAFFSQLFLSKLVRYLGNLVSN